VHTCAEAPPKNNLARTPLGPEAQPGGPPRVAKQVRIRPVAKYSGAMSRRGVSIAAALALGVTGGALLGGCGGGTKTVSVSEAAAPTTVTNGATTASTPTRATTTSTMHAPATTTTEANQGTGGQSASTTRTAPAPAFTETDTQSGAAPAGAQTAGAAAVVVAHGYTPTDVSDYHPTQTLRVLVGARTGSADGYAQRAFFFLDGRYLGTDSSQPSASIHVVSQSDTEVVLAYALYRSHDSLCCPSGGQAVVHFQLNDGTLVPLQPLPPASSATGLARQ
jgi:hypothetical protein